MSRTKLLFNIFIAVLLFVQCTYHNKEDYFSDNPNTCQTEEMSYTEDISPILENNCISCHNTSNSSGGINLSTYELTKQVAESGQLLGVIRHDNGFSPMPLSAAKLDDCTINKVSAWIDQVLKNN